VPVSQIIDGLPLCALDEHTRPGKQAINRLVGESSTLRLCLQRFVPRQRWTSAAQIAAFYVDGTPIARRLDWPLARPLEVLGAEGDLASALVPRAGAQPLIEAMQANLDRLNEIRAEIWNTLRSAPQLSA
jgi:hypothetical protein